jgi:uncharacterized Fe-S cluster protein YjdI
MEKTYTKGELTVYWKPDLCIHSTACFKALPTVFKPKERPWIDVNGAASDAIRKAVLACPSKALSLQAHLTAPKPKPVNEALPFVTVLLNGPLEVHGNIGIEQGGRAIELIGKTYFCRCGASANKPYCDGSHRQIGFQG